MATVKSKAPAVYVPTAENELAGNDDISSAELNSSKPAHGETDNVRPPTEQPPEAKQVISAVGVEKVGLSRFPVQVARSCVTGNV
jgi:hypothetical protein